MIRLLEELCSLIRTMPPNEGGNLAKYPDICSLWPIEPSWAQEDQPKAALRMAQRGIQRHAGAHGSSAQDRPGKIQEVHKRNHIIGKGIKPQLFLRAKGPGLTMATAVQPQQAKSGRQFEKGEDLFGISAQPMLKQEGHPLTFLEVMEVEIIVGEEWHLGQTARGDLVAWLHALVT